MYYLVYASQKSHTWSEDELIELLKISQRNNIQFDITGMLVYLNDRFIQILEGGETEVVRLYEIIKNDPRHNKIIKVLEGEMDKRNFSGWSMGFKSIHSADLKEMTGYNTLAEFFDGTEIDNESHPALIFMKLFYEKNLRDYQDIF